MKKKYLFFDIDGTLVPTGQEISSMPESALLALQKLKDAGHFLAIATGRSQAKAFDLMEELGFENMVSDGGYGVTIEKKLLGIAPLNRDDVIALIDECKEKGFPWAIQTNNTKTRSAPDERFFDLTHDVYMNTEVIEGLDPRNYPEIYKAYIACKEKEEEALVTLKKLPWCRYHEAYLFVEPTDKAYGIKRIMDHFHADYKDVIVFGDNNNDLSMFIDEWYKVAMGNSTDPIKEKADLITADIMDDGLYKACEKLSLFEKVTEI